MNGVDGTLKFDTKIDNSGFSSGLSGLGKTAAGAIGAIATSLGGMAAYAISVGSSFESAMSEVGAISGATGFDLDRLGEKAKAMGAATKFSATESAEAMKYMAMAGWDTEQMLDGLEGVMNLAAASGASLATTSDIVTDALTAFGLSASDSSHFADVLAKTSSSANTNVELMGETFKYVAPVAGALGYSIEDTSLAIGLMANAGIKGSQAGTDLRSTLSRMASPTKEVKEAMASLGIEMTNSDGTAKSLGEVIDQLREGFAGLDETQRVSMASTIAGKNAMSGLLAIVNAGEADYNALKQAISEADGAAEKMANTMQDNLQGKFTIMKSALEGLGIAAYEKFSEPLKGAVEVVTDQLSRLTSSISRGKLSKSFDQIADSIGDVAEIAGTGLVKGIELGVEAFGFLVDHGQQVITLMATVGTAMLVYKKWSVIVAGAKVASTLAAAADLALATAKGVLTGSITAAAGAQEMLNIAMMVGLNPTALLVAAIAGLCVGMVAFVAHAAKAGEVQLESANAVQESAKAYDDLKFKIEDSNAAVEETTEKVEINTKAAELLANQVEELAAKENKSASDKALLKAKIEELNELLPDLNLLYDEETDSLNRSSDAIARNIQANKDLQMAEAYREHSKEIVSQLAEAELGYAEAKEAAKAAEDELNTATEKRQALLDKYDGNIQKVCGSEAQAWSKANSEWLKAQENLDDARTNVNHYYKSIQDLEGQYDRTALAAEEFENRANWDNLINQAEAAGIKIPDALRKAVDQAKQIGIAIPEELAQGMLDGSIEPQEAAAQIQQLIDQATSDTSGQAQNGKAKTDALGNAMEEEAPNVEAKAKTVKEAADRGTSDSSVQAQNGTTSAAEYARGFRSKEADAAAAGAANRQAAERETGKTDQFDKDGDDGAAAYNNSMGSQANYAASKKSGAGLVSSAEKGTADSATKGKSGGDSFGSGYNQGLGGWIAEVCKTGARMVQNLVTTVKREQDSHSPSKKARKLGAFVGEGYAKGIEDEYKTTADAAAGMVKEALGTLQDTNSEALHLRLSISDQDLSRLRDAVSNVNARIQRSLGMGDDGFYQSAGVSARTVNYYSSITVNNGDMDPVQAAQQLQAMHRRMEWQKS